MLVSGRAGKPEMVWWYGTHGDLASTNNKFIIGKHTIYAHTPLAHIPPKVAKNKNKVELSANVILNDKTCFRSLFQTCVCTLYLEGQCYEISDFWLFSWNSFPQAPEYTVRAVSNFSKISGDICSSRCTTSDVDTGGKWKKSSIIKILIILFWHLWEVELTYRYIFPSSSL